MKQKFSFIVLLVLMTIFNSCQKETRLLTLTLSNQAANQQLPTIRIDKYFPNGILQFKSKESFKSFFEKVEQNAGYVKQVLPNFKSFQTTLDNFAAKQSLSVNNRQKTPATMCAAPAPAVGQDEYLMDMRQAALPVETLQPIVNNDLDVIIENQLYQFTRIGQFQVSMDVIDNYLGIFEDNLDDIYFNPNFTSMPNETALGNNQYQVSTGIIRDDATIGDDIISEQKMIYLPEPGGGFPDLGGGSGGSPGTNLVPDYYVNYKTSGFNTHIGIVFNDWAKRRLVFKTQNRGIPFSFFHLYAHIDIKAKIQREKKFLWITYWGPSYADELVVGFDNMDLETDYIFPYPQQFSQLSKPTFDGLADFKVGDVTLKTLNINVNINALNYSLNNTQVANFIDGQFNSLVGNIYNDLFKEMENKFLNSIDRTYISRYADYTRRVNNLDDQNRLKWVLGKGERKQGYSHENTWTFDYNFGISFKQNGGVPGGYPAKINYSYNMKSGSFFGRARVGNVWHGIRIIVKN